MTLIPVLTFLVFFAGIYAAYWAFVVRPEQEIAGVARKRLRAGKTGVKDAARRSAILKQIESMSSIGSVDAMLRRSQSRVKGLQTLIQQSGASVTVGTILAASATLSLLAFLVVQRLVSAGLSEMPGGALYAFVVAVVAAAGAVMIPVSVLRFLRKRRMFKFEEQFPEALDLLSRALKAGHAFTTGIDMVATEMPKPVGPEFRDLYDRQNFGMAMPDALKAFSDRVPVLDARFFVTAVLIQRESGGNLSEVLDNLAGVIRERFRVKRQMRVLSAHGRITGYILVCLPPVLGLVLMSVNPEHRRTMLGNPLGIQMLVGAGIMQIIGTLIIRKIVDVEGPKRILIMEISLALTMITIFASVALVAGSLTYVSLERSSPQTRRLRDLLRPRSARHVSSDLTKLNEPPGKVLSKIGTFIPKSPKTMSKLQRRMALAGMYKGSHAVWYSLAEIAGAAVGFLLPAMLMGWSSGFVFAVLGAIVGYLVPSFVLERRIKLRQKLIQNGLPDALDLMIVCLEAGLALDGALLKCSEELYVAHPALAEELRLINVETRAGKPRLEAFKNFASRTKVDDVRSLVSMLIQTDRFGTSVAQALRTHAEVSRTKRRQRAEERAAKIGVKMVFPLVFCLFPAFYVVTLGPAVIKFVQAFGAGGFVGGN